MSSLNKIMLIGNLGKDPEVKYTPSGVNIARFSLATSDSVKKGDSWEEKTEWHNIVLFGKMAETAGNYLKKGSTVYIEGRISTNSWEDDKGIKKYRTEILGSSMKIISKKESLGQSTYTSHQIRTEYDVGDEYSNINNTSNRYYYPNDYNSDDYKKFKEKFDEEHEDEVWWGDCWVPKGNVGVE